jgi:catechol 2,3-dioxygenase-like lactoylglutathione lyase family enzyme
MEPPFLGIRHVALNVRDVQKSLHFYSDILGMKLEWMPDPDNAYLTSGQDNLALHKLSEEAAPSANQLVHHIGILVKQPEDVDKWAERLRAHGVALAQQPKAHRDGARSFYFHDPDGLLIQLIYHPPISDNAR